MSSVDRSLIRQGTKIIEYTRLWGHNEGTQTDTWDTCELVRPSRIRMARIKSYTRIRGCYSDPQPRRPPEPPSNRRRRKAKHVGCVFLCSCRAVSCWTSAHIGGALYVQLSAAVGLTAGRRRTHRVSWNASQKVNSLSARRTAETRWTAEPPCGVGRKTLDVYSLLAEWRRSEAPIQDASRRFMSIN